MFLLNRGGPSNGNVLAKSLHDARPDAIDLLQIIRRFKWAILLAMIDNGFGFGRPNSLKGLKLGLSCSIDVDSSVGSASKYEQGDNKHKQFHIFPQSMITVWSGLATCAIEQKKYSLEAKSYTRVFSHSKQSFNADVILEIMPDSGQNRVRI